MRRLRGESFLPTEPVEVCDDGQKVVSANNDYEENDVRRPNSPVTRK